MKSRFDCLAFEGFRAVVVATFDGWFKNAGSLLGSIGCCLGAPGSGKHAR